MEATLRERQSIASKRRLDALMETIAGYVILLAINMAWFPESLGWTDTALHPYFVVVLLIATRYGTTDGLVAGVLGAVMFTWLQMGQHPAAFQSLSVLVDLELMRTPYLLLLLGTLLGEVRQVAEDEMIGLWKRFHSARADLETISSEATVVRKYNEDLQERIASATQTTGAFYEAAAAVQTLREREALEAALEIVERFVGAEKCAVYIRGREAWDLRVQRGWANPAEFKRNLSLANPLLKRVADGEVVTMMDVADTEGSDIVLAAPLYHGEAGAQRQLYGALTVQAIPLTAMNLATVRNLFGVAQWASRVLSSAERFERVRERDPLDDVTGAYRYPYLLRRLDEECGRWRRYHTPVTMLIVQVRNFDRVPRRKRAAFLRRIARLLQGHVRAVDLVARWKSADTFAVVLPATDGAGARVLAGRLHDQFSREVLKDVPRAAELALKFGMGAAGEHGDRREELIRSAEGLQLK